jgi:hypothetical protein
MSSDEIFSPMSDWNTCMVRTIQHNPCTKRKHALKIGAHLYATMWKNKSLISATAYLSTLAGFTPGNSDDKSPYVYCVDS